MGGINGVEDKKEGAIEREREEERERVRIGEMEKRREVGWGDRVEKNKLKIMSEASGLLGLG